MKSVDKYVYPDTNILINKFGCRDADKLREIEALSTGGNLAYLQVHPIEGNFDFKHLKDIHHFIFQVLGSGGINHPESLRIDQSQSTRISQCSGSTPFL